MAAATAVNIMQNISPKTTAGVVVGAGKMMKTVKVRMARQEWNRHIRKNYTVHYNLLVNDPNSSVREGDIITMTPERHSKHVMHTVSAIVAPFGTPLTERPPLLTQEERETVYLEKRLRKLERRRTKEAEEMALKREERVVKGKEASEKGRGNKTNEVSKQEEHGRQVLPGGLHKFGKINEEMLRGKKRVEEREAKVEENVVRQQEAEAESGTGMAQEALKKS